VSRPLSCEGHDSHLPPGTDLFFQCGIADSAAPAGASLSSAVRALQP